MADNIDWEEIAGAQNGDTSKDKSMGKPMKERAPFSRARGTAGRNPHVSIPKQRPKESKGKEGEINGR